jgi:hypothetical protein
MSMRLYIRDTLLPPVDKDILDQLGVDRDEFFNNVLYGELTRDPLDYEASVICSMDDFLVQHLTEMEYAYFMVHKAQLMAYEENYIRAQIAVARYLKPILKHGNYDFDLRVNPNHGHYVDLIRC